MYLLPTSPKKIKNSILSDWHTATVSDPLKKTSQTFLQPPTDPKSTTVFRLAYSHCLQTGMLLLSLVVSGPLGEKLLLPPTGPRKFRLAPMGVLAPVSPHAGHSAQPPIDTSGSFPARVSAESISPNFPIFRSK